MPVYIYIYVCSYINIYIRKHRLKASLYHWLWVGDICNKLLSHAAYRIFCTPTHFRIYVGIYLNTDKDKHSLQTKIHSITT